MATSIVTVHLVAYLREEGYSPGFAATWTGLIGAMSVTGRIVVTVLGRRWPLAITTAALFAIQALAVGVLVLTQGPAGWSPSWPCSALGIGLISLARAALVADFFGVAAYASINGLLTFALTSPGPPPRWPRPRCTPRPATTSWSWAPWPSPPWPQAWP